MRPSLPLFFFSSFVYLLLLPSEAMGSDEGNMNAMERRVSIGAIVDFSSCVGKEEKVAMTMAIDDFYNSANRKPLLIFKDSKQEPIQAAFAAMDLIHKQGVQAILGLRAWDEAALIADMGNKARVPILSFSDIAPPWAAKRWPFLVQATHSQYSQMKAIAAIIGTWQWRRVNFIYEDVNSVATSILPNLVDALREVDCEIDFMLPLSPLASCLSKELEKLQSRQSTVYIVHTSLQLATHLFMEAKKMKMLEKNYVWITTDAITSLLDHVNASVISSMQGILGVKSYFPQNGSRYMDFKTRFRRRFNLEHPKEVCSVPGIFGMQAYDAAWAVALAMEGRTNRKTGKEQMNFVGSLHGKRLLDEIFLSNFKGLTGEFRFIDGELVPSRIFRVVNVVRKSYRELGFWTEGSGFSSSINEGVTYNSSMSILGQVFWPGGPWSVPRGWTLPTRDNPLKIGVPNNSTFKQFVSVRNDSDGKVIADGFSIRVFDAVRELLPYHLPFEYCPYGGSYDSLVEQISLKTYDAVVGDTSIVANRCKQAEFSQPWAEPGLQMVVFKKSMKSEKAWLFMKPFTKGMWGLTVGFNIYNGLVVWLIERMHNPDFNGSAWNQIGSLIWLAFSTLFSLHGEGLHSNLSRMTMIVWLFVALVITQSYTASLTSMLTITRIQSSIITVESLKSSNAKIGCDEGSFVISFLVDVLGFQRNNIRTFTSYDDYPLALRKGEIAAAFLEVPYVKVLQAKYCNDFEVEGQTYKVGGFGFVFPRGSPILPDISKAVLQVSETGKLLALENELVSSYNCSGSESNNDHDSLDVASFGGLFVITGGTSTVALLMFVLRFAHQRLYSSGRYIHATPTYGHHDPNNDELFMFALEMGRQGHGLNLGAQDEHGGEENMEIIHIIN